MLGKESIIDLAELLNTRIRVKLTNRELTGVLKSYDKIPNLVLEDTIEETSEDRELGIIIIRGQMILSIMPDTVEHIENPFNL